MAIFSLNKRLRYFTAQVWFIYGEVPKISLEPGGSYLKLHQHIRRVCIGTYEAKRIFPLAIKLPFVLRNLQFPIKYFLKIGITLHEANEGQVRLTTKEIE